MAWACYSQSLRQLWIHGNIWWVSWNDFMGLPHPDFCWETENGTVLVDFKTCPKGKTAILDSNGKFYAGHYQPQFECYAHALKAAEIIVLAQLLYYPVSGLLIELHYE